MRAAAAAAAAATALGDPSPFFSPSGLTLPGAFPAYLCAPVLADAAGREWGWDLSPIAGAFGAGVTGGYTYTYEPCGVSPTACLPPGDTPEQSYAAVTQVWPGQPPGGTCVNPATGRPEACTRTCRPAAQGVPQFELLPGGNASAGVAAVYAGVLSTVDDDGCGRDPATGRTIQRSSAIHHVCDPGVPKGAVVYDGVVEGPVCHYVLSLRSAAACPTPADEAYPLPPPGPALRPDAPLAPYLVRPGWAQPGGGYLPFDLSSLWAAGEDYTFTNATSGATYAFAVAGAAASVCAPAGWIPAANSGQAIVYEGPPPPPGATCALDNGTAVPCTRGCHVLATGGPFIRPTDPTRNPGRGGLTLEWPGVVFNAGEAAGALWTTRGLRCMLPAHSRHTSRVARPPPTHTTPSNRRRRAGAVPRGPGHGRGAAVAVRAGAGLRQRPRPDDHRRVGGRLRDDRVRVVGGGVQRVRSGTRDGAYQIAVDGYGKVRALVDEGAYVKAA